MIVKCDIKLIIVIWKRGSFKKNVILANPHFIYQQKVNALHESTYLIYFYCTEQHQYVLVAVGSSGILKAKQKLGVTFNFDKQDVIFLE